MSSHYRGFNVNYETSPGQIVGVGAGVSVKVRRAGGGADEPESPLTTDANGDIGGGDGGAGGTLSTVPVGTVVNFRVEQFEGMASSESQITT
jgi:hypothetical protein